MPTYIFPGTLTVNVSAFVVTATVTSQAGNVTIAIGGGTVWRFKTAVITTNATVANRSIGPATGTVSSKVVVANSTNADLLDREFVVIGLNPVQIFNGQAGDTWLATYEQEK